MNQQLLFTLVAIGLGFVAGFFFCVGSIASTPESIAETSRQRWGYSLQVASAAAAQHATYFVGGIYLILSFGLQVGAALAPPTAIVQLPGVVSHPASLLVAVLLPSTGLGLYASKKIQLRTLNRVRELLVAGSSASARTE